MLVVAARQGSGDAVVIRNAPLSVHRLLATTGLDEVIRIEGEPIDAYQAAS